MDIAVIGTGYIGLVTAVCLASKGHRVIGVDQDADKVRRLNAGDPVIYEPGVDELLRAGLGSGRLRFCASIAEGVAASQALFICVGTPPSSDGSADLTQVENVTREIAGCMDGYRLLIEKSTVPVKTAGWVERTVRLHNHRQVDFDVASNPEFTREAMAVQDFLEPDRIVIGVSSERAAELMLEIYRDFDCPKIVTDVSTSEIIKHASNSFLAMKISYINLIADLCEAAGGDVKTVADGMGLDARIGRAFLGAGVGYGGSCFPKDVKAFCRIGEDLGLDMSLLHAVDGINERRVGQLVAKLRQALWIVKDKTIAVWGLAFKAGTDDTRSSQAIRLAVELLREGANVRLYDPQAAARARHELPPSDEVVYCASALEAAQGASALIVATDWPEFREIDLAALHTALTTPIVVDGRNLFCLKAMERAGFEYYSVGRRSVSGHG